MEEYHQELRVCQRTSIGIVISGYRPPGFNLPITFLIISKLSLCVQRDHLNRFKDSPEETNEATDATEITTIDQLRGSCFWSNYFVFH